MDFLIRKNVIKKNKVIVNIEQEQINVLGMRFVGRKAVVTGSYFAENQGFTSGNDLDARGIAGAVRHCLYDVKAVKSGDVVVSIPSQFVKCRLESVKNIKISEMDKHIKGNHQLSKVSELTHIIDWSYLGQREESGDTLSYYLVAAINKSIATSLLDEFSKQGMTVTGLTFSENNMVCLTDLWHDDYEHINRLFINFGANNAQILVDNGGTIVYSRLIDFPFEADLKGVSSVVSEFQNEIIRIIRMCGNEGIDTSKIVCTGNIPESFQDSFLDNDIAVEVVNFNTDLVGNGYEVSVSCNEIQSENALTVGAGISILQSRKRLNLLPPEQKNKQTEKALIFTIGGILLAFALIISGAYINLAVANHRLGKLQLAASEYEKNVAKIESLEISNKKNKDFIMEYEKDNFPFYLFLQFIEEKKPTDLTILSIDSPDRIVDKEASQDGDGEKENRSGDLQVVSEESEVSGEELEKEITEDISKEIEFTDLIDGTVSVRGHSTDSTDISLFLRELSLLPYVENLELKALEENTLGGETVTIFEAVLTFGGVSL